MTAAHEQNLESKKRRSRFVTQAQIVGHKMSGKRKRQWDQITKCLTFQCDVCGCISNGYRTDVCSVSGTAQDVALKWKAKCQAGGIGAGVLSWFFWNFFLQYLVELAKLWIEAQRNADRQQG
jgi:hypothetical protein